MADKEDCIYRLRLGIYARVFLTILLIFAIEKYFMKSKYLLLIIVAKILLTDAIDSIFTLFYKGTLNDCINPCTELHYYQSADKIMDLVNYILIYFMLDYDNLFGIFILWRLIGVILFNITKKRIWLVVFFDFMKEYLLYRYFIGKNNSYLPLFILGKIGFEYYFHIYRLSKSRCLKLDKRT